MSKPELTTSIKMEDIEVLEGTFAYLTENGWMLPIWLIQLKVHAKMRDMRQGVQPARVVL